MSRSILTAALAFILGFLATAALAQSTATPVVPGTLTQAGCGPGQTTCWQPTTPLTPVPILLTSFTSTGTGSLSASTTTSNTALPANGSLVAVTNTGAVTAYVNLGVGSGLVATTNNYAIPPGQVAYLNVGNATYIAAITTSSTASLTLASGNLTSSIASSGSTNATIVGPLGRQADAASVSTALSNEDVAILQAATPAGSNTIGGINNLPATVDTNTGAAGASTIRTVPATGSTQAATSTITSPIPTITITAGAYSANNVIGGIVSFTGQPNSGVIANAACTFDSGSFSAGTIDFEMFNASPTGGGTTDHAAYLLTSTDTAKHVGTLHLSDCSSLGGALAQCQALYQNQFYTMAAAGTTIFIVPVVRTGTPTFAGTGDMKCNLQTVK